MRKPFKPTPEQTEELAETLFGGDGSDPWPEWFSYLSPADKATAIVAAEVSTCQWAYSEADIKRRTAAASSTSSQSLRNTRLTAASVD